MKKIRAPDTQGFHEALILIRKDRLPPAGYVKITLRIIEQIIIRFQRTGRPIIADNDKLILLFRLFMFFHRIQHMDLGKHVKVFGKGSKFQGLYLES